MKLCAAYGQLDRLGAFWPESMRLAEGALMQEIPADSSTPKPVAVESDEQSSAIAEATKKPAPRSAPKGEREARDRLKAAIRRFSRPLADLAARDATKLATKHLRQVEMYAVNEGVEWVILTNGAVWRVYHLSGGLPVVVDLAFESNLLSEETVAQKANQLFYLTQESLKRRQVDELWKAKRATSPKSLADVLASEVVADAIRKELRRRTGQNVEVKEVVRLLTETVVRPECLG